MRVGRNLCEYLELFSLPGLRSSFFFTRSVNPKRGIIWFDAYGDFKRFEPSGDLGVLRVSSLSEYKSGMREGST